DSMGFKILATEGTAGMLRRNGIDCEVVLKSSDVRDGVEGRSIVDRIRDGEVDLILNTPAGSAGARHDGYEIRGSAVTVGVPLVTTVQGVTAAVQGIEALRRGELTVRALQELDHAVKA
ncbi:MAG: carbamoyl phosphate synthase large subunit, partial [Corynebacterium sp.]|nr:carbamoyl phosphate synthase large subunit [Corynebacterium sp.]